MKIRVISLRLGYPGGLTKADANPSNNSLEGFVSTWGAGHIAGVAGRACRFSLASGKNGCDLTVNSRHRLFWISEVTGTANSYKHPSQALQNGLACQVVLQILKCMVTVAITFDGNLPSIGMDNHVNPASPYAILRRYLVSRSDESSQDLTLKIRFGFRFERFEIPHGSRRIECMLDQAPPQISFFQICFGVQRVNHPHLVACSTGGNVKALLVHIPWTGFANREGSVLGSIDQREEYHVPLIPLKLRSVTAENPSDFVFIRRKFTNQVLVNLSRLLLAYHRYDTECLSCVFRLLRGFD